MSDLLERAAKRRLAGLFHFAEGLLAAKDKTLMRMKDAGLGVFPEEQLAGLPGLEFGLPEDGDDERPWLTLRRLRRGRPPPLPDELADWIEGDPGDPSRRPTLKDTIFRDLDVELVSFLVGAGLLDLRDVPSVDPADGLQESYNVAIRRARLRFLDEVMEEWLERTWTPWAAEERLTRRSIGLYNSFFRLHNLMSGGSSSEPPELVWGIGIAKWKMSDFEVDMPLIEQLVEMEVDEDGLLSIRARSTPPTLNLAPLHETGIDTLAEARPAVDEAFEREVHSSENDFTPFDATWEPVLGTVAARISSTGRLVGRDDLLAGAPVETPSDTLTVYASWAIYARPRSDNQRLQDLARLRSRIESTAADAELPASLGGFVAPPPVQGSTDYDDWGLSRTTLVPRPDAWTTTRAPSRVGSVDDVQRVDADPLYFFPLASNAEQSRIIEYLDANDVVTVTGPPGTGKTHSIANIIGHYIATGRRVLVTARTAEALTAIREKLPDGLANLVIANVASDREGNAQLERAIQQLSSEVAHLDIDATRVRIARLERSVAKIDEDIRDVRRNLAELAIANLSPIDWDGQQMSVLEAAKQVASTQTAFGWFADRPKRPPSPQEEDLVQRLHSGLRDLGDDIVYAGVEIPEPEELPSSSDLLKLHDELLTRRAETRDIGRQPPMARDSADADDDALRALRQIQSLEEDIQGLPAWARTAVRTLLDEALSDEAVPYPLRVVRHSDDLLSRLLPANIEHDFRDGITEEILDAVERGSLGQRPLPFHARLFNRELHQDVSSIRVDGVPPVTQHDWTRVLDSLEAERRCNEISKRWEPLADEGLLPHLSSSTGEAVTIVREARQQVDLIEQYAADLDGLQEALERLFPFGLEISSNLRSLSLGPLEDALLANVGAAIEAPDVIQRLESLTIERTEPAFEMIRSLAGRLGQADTTPEEIISKRSAITAELERLAERRESLASYVADLDRLREAGVPRWADRIREASVPVDVAIPPSWREAWIWAKVKRDVDEIVALGNGDDLRERAQGFARRRERVFEDLIRERALLGLKRRLTDPIQSALMQFTNAVKRLGRGTGKSAGRWRRAIRDAATRAAPAAPVWVMPEYKIAEQLPAELQDFDLVILDEASQSDITALSALARGKRLLIVGDEEQVSPSAVGVPQQRVDDLRARFLEGLPNKNIIDEKSSIFDIAMQMHPSTHLMLREHFRSVEPIIQFSTRFYSERLIPLRVPKPSERFDPPLVDVYVEDGQRREREKINEAEASFIVNEIATIVGDPAHEWRDLAVISLVGREQADLIERMLMEDDRVGPDAISRHHIVCGDSRTMQGQERSVVFLSMVDSRDTVRLTRDVPTQQRLNVAMSRARDRLYLVRSVEAKDLREGDLKLEVVRHFQNPMPEGRKLAGLDVLDRCQSEFEREVCERLLDANYRVQSQVTAGPYSIDLVVEGADDKRLAVELDGDAWHPPEQWDQDVMRQAALERAGWTFWRVFGSQWMADPEHYWSQLVATLDAMGIEPIGGVEKNGDFSEHRVVQGLGRPVGNHRARDEEPQLLRPSDPSPEAHGRPGPDQTPHRHQLGTDQAQSRPRGATRRGDGPEAPMADTSAAAAVLGSADAPFKSGPRAYPPRPTTTAAKSSLDPEKFYDASYRSVVGEFGCAFVDRVGPVPFKMLCDHVARAHRFKRTGKEIKSVVWKSMRGRRPTTRGTDEQVVFWPSGSEPQPWIPYRGLRLDGVARDWTDLARPELMGLAREVIESDPADPEREMASRLGLKRLKERTKAEFEAILDEARATF